MKKCLLIISVLLSMRCSAQLLTPWAEILDPQNVLNAYPRPMLQRTEWKNLNGMWHYAIAHKDDIRPTHFEGDILVPFAIESRLSGIQRPLPYDNALWYSRTFTIPTEWSGKDVILHFGAVDYEAQVFVNEHFVKHHRGGYAAFSCDITKHLKSGDNVLTVKVMDNSDEATQPVGKQRRNPGRPGSIWYTSISGIWQTVWLEPVSHTHISNVQITPDADNHRFIFNIQVANARHSTDKILIKTFFMNKRQSEMTIPLGMPAVIDVKHPHLWTPDTPDLYDFSVQLISDGQTVDDISTYSALRKISVGKTGDQYRIQLNNKDIFMFGPLDQGYWPDGLYTAPTDDALLFDIQKTKDWGFNTIRKHMKVEPERWYYYCDSIGLLVWQDMPSLFGTGEPWRPEIWYDGQEGFHAPEVVEGFKDEWREIITQLYSHPCIVVWTPFNEAWGQFCTAEIAEYTRQLDPTRLINPASGGNHYHTADILDLHSYARPPHLAISDAMRPVVLGEYGGLGQHIPGHRWLESDATTYVNYNSTKELTDAYVEQAEAVIGMSDRICSAIYTQTTDVETEVNGLMTYDRKVMKMEEERLKEINRRVCNTY